MLYNSTSLSVNGLKLTNITSHSWNGKEQWKNGNEHFFQMGAALLYDRESNIFHDVSDTQSNCEDCEVG